MKTVFKLICQAREMYEELLNQRDQKESRILLKKIGFFKEKIKLDFTYGETIKKRNIEKNKDLLNAFFQRYNESNLINIKNCFCCDLTRTQWRMLYTIKRDLTADTRHILCFMIVDHKTYEKYFT